MLGFFWELGLLSFCLLAAAFETEELKASSCASSILASSASQSLTFAHSPIGHISSSALTGVTGHAAMAYSSPFSIFSADSGRS